MVKKFKLVFNEIKKGENLDLYIIILLAVVVAILGIAQVASFEIISAVILATLGLLAASLLANRRSTSEMKDITDQLNLELKKLRDEIREPARISDVFLQGYPDLGEELSKAKRVSIEGSVLSGTLTRYSAQFIKILERGGSLRFLISEPTSEVGAMQAFRSSLVKDTDLMFTTTKNSLKTMKAMRENTADPLNVQIRMMPYLASYGLIIIESNDGVEKAYVRVLAFQTPSSEQPAFQVNNQTDSLWFKFFSDQFEKLWESSKKMP